MAWTRPYWRSVDQRITDDARPLPDPIPTVILTTITDT
jgi:hypothetical protein